MKLKNNSIDGDNVAVTFDALMSIGGDDNDFGFSIELVADVEVSIIDGEVTFEQVKLIFEDDDSIILPSDHSLRSNMNNCETLKDYVLSESQQAIVKYLYELAEDQYEDDLYERSKQSQLDKDI